MVPNAKSGVTAGDFSKFVHAGFSVIPVLPPDSLKPGAGKAPLIKNWTTQEPPTTEEIESWVRKTPGLNIGLPTGSINSLVAIDVDGEGGEARLQQICMGDLPTTWEYKTARGIRRIYITPFGLKLRKKKYEVVGKPDEECALLGDGQQVVIPPSVHPTGVAYEWLPGRSPDEIDPAPAPLWMLEAMSSKPEKEAFGDLIQLSSKCPLFRDQLRIQQSDGLPEGSWFRWISLLEKAGKEGAALAFSRLSHKHNEESAKRIEGLNADTKVQGMVRCTTFGCEEVKIGQCHVNIRRNDAREVTNSPGALLLGTTKSSGDVPQGPSNPVYEPYIKMLEGTDYFIDTHGNVIYQDEKRSFRLANFLAIPIKEITTDDGITTERNLIIEGLLSGGQELEPISVNGNDFQYMNWVAKWGIKAVTYPGFSVKDHLKVVTQSLTQGIISETIYTHLGWREVKGEWAYFHFGGCIGPDGVSVELDKALRRYELPLPDTDRTEEAARFSLNILDLALRDVTIPLLALTYLSPLCEPLRLAGIEPNFVVWLYGLTGTRKTSISMVFLSHFGNFLRGSPPASFKDTANALEKRASLVKDSLLVIDDYHPNASMGEDKALASTAQRMLRMYGDRVGRGRLTSTTVLRPEHVPRGMALVTGEDIARGHSSVARFLGVEVRRDDVGLEILTRYQASGNLLAQAMRGYIEWLRPQMPNITLALQERFLELRGEFQKTAAHGRLGETAAWLTLGFEQALGYFQSVGVVSETKADELWEEAVTVMARLMHKQNEEVNIESPAQRFLTTFGEMLSLGKIAPLLFARASKETNLMHGFDQIGWKDDTFYYLSPSAIYAATQQHLGKKGSSLGITERMLWKQLSQIGAIVSETHGDRIQHTPKKTPPGKPSERRRVLQLLKSHVKDADSDD